MKKRKKISLLLIIFIVIAIVITVSYLNGNEQKRKILLDIEDELFDLNKYYVYGTHLNLECRITDIEIEKVSDVKFVLIDTLKNEKEYNAIYKTDGIEFEVVTSNVINEGIYLEGINSGKYFLLLKIVYANGEKKYFSMKNNTDYKDIEYYTITQNNSNRKINIKFDNFKSEDRNIPYMKVNAEKVKLPETIYDISIDPGHGGSDPGAVYKQYKEAEIAMKHSAELKKALEDIGLKVIITRDGTEDTSQTSPFNVYSVYDYNGRVNMIGRAKVKYNFSIHINSSEINTLGGTEIYAPPNATLGFAQLLADNIVNIAKTTYSTRDKNKVSKGVYVRTFTENEISESAKDARKQGFTPYNITTSTPYLYMIREIGGAVTGAYIDGRNEKVGTNQYYNSNIGVESYLIELGYIINKTDLNNMLNNQSLYVEAITKSIKDSICKE